MVIHSKDDDDDDDDDNDDDDDYDDDGDDDDDENDDKMATCLPMGKLGNRTKLLFLALVAVSIWCNIF